MSETTNKFFPLLMDYRFKDRIPELRAAGISSFPIAIPWGMIQPHEKQALRNHGGQTLARLSERGGLSPSEAIAVLDNRNYYHMFLIDACQELNKRIDNWEWLQAPDNSHPLDIPLPADVTINHITFRKGVNLVTFIDAARHWHTSATQYEKAKLEPFTNAGFKAGLERILNAPVETVKNPQRRWRHKVRGTVYTEIIRGTAQTNHRINDEETVVVYQGEDGRLWIREVGEFEDGRFELIPDEDATTLGAEDV